MKDLFWGGHRSFVLLVLGGVSNLFHLHGRRDERTMWSLPHSTRSTIIVETAVVALRWVEKTQKGIFGMKIIVFLVSIVYLHVFS